MSTKRGKWLLGPVIAALALAGCISQGATPSTDGAGTTEPPGTVFPSGIDTVPNRPPLLVERASEPRDVTQSDLPAALRINMDLLGLSDDEARCINTTLVDYLNGAGAVYAVEDDVTVAALGGAILVCSDQDELAGFISAKVKGTTPNLPNQKVDCIREEIEVADPAALAVFLGAYTYAGPGMERLQEPFVQSFTAACGLY